MIPTAVPVRSTLALLCLALPLAAHALCTSDGVRPPTALMERFINADCATCWQDASAASPAPAGTLVLDWVVPGQSGEDAPLSSVATVEARERLAQLGRPAPAQSAQVSTRREGGGRALRLAQGSAFNDYVGASIELAAPGRNAWSAWLLLVERLPAGTEGSPVARNLVRNVFRPDWGQSTARPPARLAETRAMQIREGAKPERLRLVAVLQDARGRIRAISQTECSE
jgi:hypothetical protein